MLERLEICRGSLREALRILEGNGLVTLKPGPGGGPVAAAHDPRNFGQMATLHLQSIGANYRQLLDARVEYETVLARKDQQYSTATSGFHRAVGVASGNPVIALAAESIYSIWSVRETAVLYPPEDREQVSIEHEQITRAIEKHDARRAERLMREHIAYQEFCELRYPARMDDIVDWK